MAELLYRFPDVFSELEVDGLAPSPPYPWIEQSWAAPDGFWRALFAHFQARHSTPPKSTPFEHYDFYHDIVVQNDREDRVAFRWHEGPAGWKEMTYSELGFRAARRARHWQGQKVEAGKTLLLVLPFGTELVVSLLSALKLGLTVSYLPPLGDLFLAHRIGALKPDFIATEPIYVPLLGAAAKKVLAPEPLNAPPPDDLHRNSHTYGPHQRVALLFSPFAKAPTTPIAVAADEAYLRPLRDGIVAFRLSIGDGFAAPGMDPLQHQPALLLAVLLCGATYVHLTPEQVSEDPRLLEAFPLKSVGISRRLREVLARGSVRLQKAWWHWWKCPSEASDLGKWHEMAVACGLDKVLGSNVFVDASAGGALLFSTKRRGGEFLPVIPSAGVRWTLADMNGSGETALGTHGLFRPERAGDRFPEPTFAVLAKHTSDWFYAGPLEPRRCGRTYPRDEVIEAIAGFPFVVQASVVPAPSGGFERPFLFVLLVFVGHWWAPRLEERQEAWRAEIENTIARRMGEEFLPDAIEFFPLYARRTKKGAVDHGWCQGQYLTGSLHRKRRGEADRILTELRALAVYARPPVDGAAE